MNLYKIFCILTIFSVQLIYAGKSVFGHIKTTFKTDLEKIMTIEGGIVKEWNKHKNDSMPEAGHNKERADELVNLFNSMSKIIEDAQGQGYKKYISNEKLFEFINEKYAKAEKLQEEAQERYDKIAGIELVSSSSESESSSSSESNEQIDNETYIEN